MKFLYLILNLSSVAVPFLASFHPRLKFYKQWKSLFLALLFTSTIFIIWDVLFTSWGVWGFNNDYYLGNKILGLPIEEWLFFICIPYACIFMHVSLLELFPKMRLSDKSVKIITGLLILISLLLAVIHSDKLYTSSNYGYATILLIMVFLFDRAILNTYLLTFLVMLIPFFVVNGILTGSFIPDEVVWYNNDENLGIRLGTIPIEDVTYAFTLMLTTLFFKRALSSDH